MSSHRMESFIPLANRLRAESRGHYPWHQVGVFPVEDDDVPYQWFNYTVGLGPEELWMPAVSIEGRAAGNELIGAILNMAAAAWFDGVLDFGDDIVVPLGIPGGTDEDAMFWVGREREPATYRQVNLTECPWCVPILWSSPLGWPDDGE